MKMIVQYSVFPNNVAAELGLKFNVVAPADTQLDTARLRARYLADNRIWLDYGVSQVAIIKASETELETLADDHAAHETRNDNCLCCCK
jgi:hypothetical protein